MVFDSISFENFNRYVTVSRETFSQLQEYDQLIHRWQSKINLIGHSTLPQLWIRHIVDSAQLFRSLDPLEKLVDLGSGAGLPGIILSLLGVKDVTLIESDKRKAAFLKEASRISSNKITVVAGLVEETDLAPYGVITARAFAPLCRILSLVEPTLKARHKLLLLKGKSYEEELHEARLEWSFEASAIASLTDTQGVILTLSNIHKNGLKKEAV